MRLPDDSSQQDPSARRRLFKVRLRHRLPSQRDQQLVCRCGGAKMHIGFGQFFFFFFKAPIFNSNCKNKEKLTVFSCSFICCLWLFLMMVVVVVMWGCSGCFLMQTRPSRECEAALWSSEQETHVAERQREGSLRGRRHRGIVNAAALHFCLNVNRQVSTVCSCIAAEPECEVLGLRVYVLKKGKKKKEVYCVATGRNSNITVKSAN